ncbi:hypothetical protein T09_9091 [Trichinella sp. T9]|nr:hypothetical protein T09_9091 [Trichinella sp. T9]
MNQGLRFRFALSESLPKLCPFVHSGICLVVIESRLEFLLRLLDLTVMFFRGPNVLFALPQCSAFLKQLIQLIHQPD